MNIIEQSRELDKTTLYDLTMSPLIDTFQNVPDGTIIRPEEWVIFEREDYEGKIATLLSIKDAESGRVRCAQSATFRENFKQIADLFGDEPFEIVKYTGQTKSGRDYIYCVLYHE